jgi:hypothetical protein
MTPEMAVALLIGLVMGILYKTYKPYADKKKAGKIQGFDTTYIWTAVVAFVGALMTALGMFSDAAVAWAQGWPFGSGYAAIVGFGFVWAVGWNYGANEAAKHVPAAEEKA